MGLAEIENLDSCEGSRFEDFYLEICALQGPVDFVADNL